MLGLAMPFRRNRRHLGTAKIFPRNARRKIFYLNRNWFGPYGVGDAVEVVVSVVVLVSEVAGVAVSIGVAVAIGLIVAIGVDSAGLVAVVVSDGEAAGVTVS